MNNISDRELHEAVGQYLVENGMLISIETPEGRASGVAPLGYLALSYLWRLVPKEYREHMELLAARFQAEEPPHAEIELP